MDLVFASILVIDLVGITIGLISIRYILKIKNLVGGRFGSGISFFVWGVSFMILAFIYTIIFIRLKLFVAPVIDIHHALMAIGMIFFVMAASRFARGIRNI